MRPPALKVLSLCCKMRFGASRHIFVEAITCSCSITFAIDSMPYAWLCSSCSIFSACLLLRFNRCKLTPTPLEDLDYLLTNSNNQVERIRTLPDSRATVAPHSCLFCLWPAHVSGAFRVVQFICHVALDSYAANSPICFSAVFCSLPLRSAQSFKQQPRHRYPLYRCALWPEATPWRVS